MIIDSSALIAVLARELDADRFLLAMSTAPQRRISAATLLETSIVIKRMLGETGPISLNRFIERAEIEVVALTPEQAHIASQAYSRFGKGTGHPARLNILDCCTYALAAVTGEPLLFKGADFDKTDLLTVSTEQ